MRFKRAAFAIRPDGSRFDLRQRAVGYPAVEGASLKGIINLVFDEFVEMGSFSHFILGSDFKHYAILWSCVDEQMGFDFDFSKEIVNIMTKSPEPEPDVISEIDTYIDKYFDREFLFITDQSKESCPSFNDRVNKSR